MIRSMLHLAGYTEIADLLNGITGPGSVEFDILRPHLVGLQKMIKRILEMQKDDATERQLNGRFRLAQLASGIPPPPAF